MPLPEACCGQEPSLGLPIGVEISSKTKAADGGAAHESDGTRAPEEDTAQTGHDAKLGLGAGAAHCATTGNAGGAGFGWGGLGGGASGGGGDSHWVMFRAAWW